MDKALILAMITGYSTAVIPGALHGIPLVWLRRQIDNSIYGEAYLERIGFAADSPAEVLAIIDKLRSGDAATLAAQRTALAAAHEIFVSSSDGREHSLAAVLGKAVDACFEEIAGRATHSKIPGER